MNDTNEMMLEFESKSINESFARTVVAAFVASLDPTIEELSDIKTAVSEAVTNSIIHGYVDRVGIIKMNCIIIGNKLIVKIFDSGVGITDIKKAREALYTSRPELERSGMGFTFMETFMDELSVISTPGKGTIVTMKKRVGKESRIKEYTQEENQKVL